MAELDRSKYLEILKKFPGIKSLFVKQSLKYKDPLKLFLELKLNRLSYFRDLPKHVKSEVIFNF